MRPLRVFLCHSSNDKPTVRELYNALKLEDWIDPWLDKAKILPGQDWEMVIEKAVDDSDVVLACLSNQAVTKEGFVQREIRYAYDMALEKPDGTIFLIPLRLDDCNVPRKLRTLHWVDYFGADKENSYSDLLVALKLRYDQKMRLEEEELERKNLEEQTKGEKEELARKFAAEKAKQEAKEKVEREAAQKAAHEKLELDAKEKAELIWRERIQKRRERSIREGAKAYDRKEKAEKFVDQVINLFSVNSRWLGIGGIILLALIFGGFGLNYLIKNLPVTTAIISSPTRPPTFEPSTSTSVPFTPTPQPTKTPIPTPTFGTTMISEKDGMVLVYVPAGEFTMGSDIGGSDIGNSDEGPEHQVNVPAFWIDQTEVTNRKYETCVDDGVCQLPSLLSSDSRDSYYGNTKYDSYPVIYVNWSQASTYCSWADRRLPTEAEWEKAARGTDGQVFPWGSGANCDKANFDHCIGDTSPIKRYPDISPYGVYDMAGNVKEWVSSLYKPYPYELNDGRENVSSSDYHVVRGGSFIESLYAIRSAYRSRFDSESDRVYIGFRCARSP